MKIIPAYIAAVALFLLIAPSAPVAVVGLSLLIIPPAIFGLIR
jgi:hypothetical protein